MFELTTGSESTVKSKNLFGVYLDYDGNIQSYDFDVEANIQTNLNQDGIWDLVVEDYKNKLMDLRGLSTFTTLTERHIECPQFTIKANESILKYKHSLSPCYGSVRECFELSMQHEACAMIHAAGGGFSDAKVKLTPRIAPLDANVLNLIFVTENGFEVIRGALYHEFKADRNPTCSTCIDGFARYQSAVARINSFIIAATDKAAFSGEYIHDFQMGTDREISEKLYETLFTVLELAKIKSIRFERIN